MKRVIKWLLGLLGVVIALLVLALVFKDSFIRTAAEKRLRSLTGMEVKIGKFSSAVFAPTFTIKQLTLANTAEFGGVPLLDVTELYVECDSAALAENKLHIKKARLQLSELDIVRNQAGQTNLFAFKRLLDQSSESKSDAPTKIGAFEFEGIDVLNLSVGNVRLVDLSDAKKNRLVHVGLENQLFRDVKGEGDLSAILFMIWLRSGGELTRQ